MAWQIPNPLMGIVNALNNLRTNVWSICLISAGCVLVLHGHSDVGASLTTGGFAILRSESSQQAQSNGNGTQAPTPVVPVTTVTDPNVPKQ